MITDNQKELLIQLYYDRGVLKKEIRSYEVSLWTLLDEFITVLKWSDVEQKGRIESPKMTLNIDGTEKFTFSIPMYYRENGKLVENPNWYNVLNDKNLMVGMRKLKVIFNKDNPEIDNVDWRNLYDKIYVPTNYNGNANLFNRPIVPANKFIEAGWDEFDGTYGTLYSSSDSCTIEGKEYDVIYTPVSMNGSVASPAALATYISSVISSGPTVLDKLNYDASHSKLLLGIYEVNSDNHNQWAEELHEMQAEWDIIRAKNGWFGYNSNPYNIEFDESNYYYYYQKYLRSINTFEFIITNVTETHERDILTCEIESEGLAFLELGKIGYKISLSLANFELVYKEWETDGEWTRYDGTKVTTQPIQNVQYWCEEAGLEPIPSDPALINSRVWYYDIQMNWDAFADGKRRDPHVVYEEAYTSSWDSNLRPLAFENFREKARSIEVENSNLYNITKTIAEKFEIFCRYEYMYDENYHIIGRKVVFYNNFMQDGLGSITLQYPYSSSKISRTMDSTAITTKLFVLDVDEHGIADAEPNASREDYILNFDFLYQTGAITLELYDAILPYYKDVRAKNDELINLLNQLIIYLELQPEIAAKKTILENSIDIDKEQIEANQRLGNALGALDGVVDLYIELSAAKPDYLLIHTDENGSRYVNLSTTNKGIVDDSITVWATFGYDKDDKPLLSNLITGFTLDHDGSNNLTTLTFTQDTSAYTSVYLLYKYDPKLYYDNVIKIWETKSAQDELDLLELTNLLSEINNKIDSTTLQIERVLREKEQIVKAFERLMGPALREGYWQPEDYSDYGDRKISNISLSTSVDLIRSTGKEMKAGWDSEPFTGELKLYYEEGANRDKVYYPCVNLKSLFGANIPTDLSDYSIVWKATNWEGLSYDWNSIKDLRVLSIGSSALIRFIKFGSEGIIPVLVVIGAQAFTEEELERLTLTGEARLEKYSISVDKISGVASVSHGDTLISINNNWIIIDKNTDETTYPIVLPRIKNSAMTLKTDTDSLFIKYGNNILSQFSDYYINTRIGEDSGGPEYYITIKPEVLIKYGLGQNFNINYILSNANTAIYLDARKVSLENAYPKVSYSIDVNLLNTSLLHTLYSKLARIVMVNDTDLKFENTFGYISLVDLDLDNCLNDTVEIKNYKTKFEDLFSTIVAQTEDIKRSGAGLTTALSGGIPLSEDGFVQTMALHKDILDAYLDSHFDSSLVVRDRLTDLFSEAGDILGGANKTLNKLKSLTLGNAGILSRFAENVAIELTTKVYRSTEKPASFKPGDIWIYTDEHGNEYRYLAMTDSSLSGSGSDFGFVRTHDGSLASIRGANVAWDAEAGIVDITGENEINIRSGNNLYLAANADVNIVGNNSVNIGGSTINIGAGIGHAHFTVSGQINTTKFTNKTNNELGSFWFRYKDGHWTYKNNSVDLADYGITIVVKENQSLVDDVDQLFVWNNGNNNITWMESNNNTMGSINLVASGITLFEEGKANTELAKVLISPYRIEMGAAELEMKAKSKIVLRSSTGTYAKTAAISISAEEGVYIGAGQGVRIYSGSPSMQVYVGPAHYSKYQKGDIWVKIKKIGNWAGHIGYDGDAGGTNFYTTSILSGLEHNTFEVEGIYDALDNWNADPDTPEPATDYGYTTDGWRQRSTSNAELSARSVIVGTGASVELNKEHLLLGFANIEKDRGSAIELTDEFVIIASGKNISGNLTTDKNINVNGLSTGLIGAKFTNSSIGFATQSGSIINAFIMNDNGLTMGTQNTGNAIDLVSSSKDQLRSHFSSTNNGSYVRIAPEGIELGSLGDLYINTDNFKLLTHSRSAGDYPNGEYIDGNTILALGSGFNSGNNPITGRESISALRTKVENGELDIKLIVNLDGAYFKGNVYADNGVFNGTVYANAGKFHGAVEATSFTTLDTAKDEELRKLLSGEIQRQINNDILTWTGKGTPRPLNAGDSGWNNSYIVAAIEGDTSEWSKICYIGSTAPTGTNDEKEKHVGDIFYDISDDSATGGQAFRYVKSNNQYYWQTLGDTITTSIAASVEAAEEDISNLAKGEKPIKGYFESGNTILFSQLSHNTGLTILGKTTDTGTNYISIFRASSDRMGFFGLGLSDLSSVLYQTNGEWTFNEQLFSAKATPMLWYKRGNLYLAGTLYADRIRIGDESSDLSLLNYIDSRVGQLDYMSTVRSTLSSVFNEAGEILTTAQHSLTELNNLTVENNTILETFKAKAAQALKTSIEWYTTNANEDTISAVRIDPDTGVWIGTDKEIRLFSSALTNNNTGSSVLINKDKILFGVSNGANGTAVSMDSNLILLAAGDIATANSTTKITTTSSTAGVLILKDYIGLATGTSTNRSLVSIKPNLILIGTGFTTESNYTSGSYILMKNENSAAKFEIGSTGIFRLLTPRVYIDGAATGTQNMFALANSDGTQYALKYTADGNLTIRGAITATSFELLNGSSISSTDYYCISTDKNTPPASDASWQTSMANIDIDANKGKYLWTKTVINIGGLPTDSYTVVYIAEDGTVDGVAASISYAVNNSSTTTPSSWKSSYEAAVSDWNATNLYLWTRTTINGTSSYSISRYTQDGTDGKDGTNGTDGKYVTSIVPLYYLKSTTGYPSAPTSYVNTDTIDTWTTIVPSWPSSSNTDTTNYCYYRSERYTWSSGDPTYSSVYKDNGLTTASATAKSAATTVEPFTHDGLSYGKSWGGKSYGVILSSSESAKPLLIGSNAGITIAKSAVSSDGAALVIDNSGIALNGTNIILDAGGKINMTGGEINFSAPWSWSTTGYDVAGSWEQDATGWYYKIDPSTSTTINTVLAGSGTYKYPVNDWLYNGGYWYYFNSSGYMLTGKQTINNTVYNFGNSGGLSANNSVNITANGIELWGNHLMMNGLEAWGRDDIIVMKRSGETQSDIEARMEKNHDWVLIKPYYDAEIVYIYKNYGASVVSELGTNVAYVSAGVDYVLLLEPLNSASSLMSFGSNAGYYLYTVTFKATTNSSSSATGCNISMTLSNGTDNVILRTAGNNTYVTLENIPANGSTNKATGNGTSGQLSGSSAVNLCTEGANLTLTIHPVNTGLRITDITVTCTCDATTSRVPCTVYYYP